MAIHLDDAVIALLIDPATVKVLTTVDEAGTPHTVAKESLTIDSDGNLLYLEGLESSRTNRNLVRSIWFEHKVAVTLIGRDGHSYQIKGRPLRSLVSGPIFQRYYAALRARLGDVDLAAVWVIAPEEVIDETWETRRQEEGAKRPHFLHLDRLVVGD